ncbi:AAA family ATPase [bacterium]|nr:AAA family ATPase [bacterium]
MIRSMKILGYRCFEDFKLEEVGRINLVTGKNNSGKSTLLEALHLTINLADPFSLWRLLARRGEITEEILERRDYNVDINHLFCNHSYKNNHICFQADLDNIPIKLNVSVVKKDDIERDVKSNSFVGPYYLNVKDDYNNIDEYYPIYYNGGMSSSYAERMGSSSEYAVIKSYYLMSTSLLGSEISNNWRRITLKPEKIIALDALRIVNSDVVDFTVARDSKLVDSIGKEGILIKLRDMDSPIPLGSLGEGSWRLLGIGMALALVKNGIILIDDLDVGLHHSAMYDLWRLVDITSRKYNIQVFATTHSRDCINALGRYLQDNPNTGDVLIHRVEKDQNTPIVYSRNNIISATQHEIEVR